jgi:hypothetical protein
MAISKDFIFKFLSFFLFFSKQKRRSKGEGVRIPNLVRHCNGLTVAHMLVVHHFYIEVVRH